jgi:hypothetical protein
VTTMTKRLCLCTVTAVAVVGACVGIAALSAGGPGGMRRSANVAADQPAPQRWLESDADYQAQHPVPADGAPNAHPGERPNMQVVSGAADSRLSALVASVLPSSATLQTSDAINNGNQLVARRLMFSDSDGVKFIVTLEDLKAPTALSFITLNRSADTYGRMPSGSEVVVATHGSPHTLQLMLVRPNGRMVTLTATTGGLGALPNTLVSQWSSALLNKLDVTGLDSLPL